MGVDERKNDRGRADTLIYMTVNPKTKTTEMVSIPVIRIQKLSEKAQWIKSTTLMLSVVHKWYADTVEELLDVPVDYFVKVNMESFKDIVDTLGGITVNSTFAFSYDGHSFGTGEINLNGDQALAYTRMRKQDPKGDFGRQQRQRQVIEGIIAKGANISSITKFGDMFKVVENNMKTNMSFDDMWTMMNDYRDARQNVKQHELKGTGARINNIYYYQLDDSSLAKVKKELKDSLEQ